MRTTLLLGLVLLACSACRQPGRNPPLLQRPSGIVALPGVGVVCGDDLQQTLLVSQLAVTHFEAAGEALGYLNPNQVRVWIVPDWSRAGTTTSDRILIRPFPPRLQAIILVHEFVHWHSLGTVIQENLPHTIQEGICDAIAIALVPDGWNARWPDLLAYLTRAHLQGRLEEVVDRLRLPVLEWKALTREERFEQYALGLVLVNRIGVEALREAAEAGSVSPEQVLEMAGVQRDGTGLFPASSR